MSMSISERLAKNCALDVRTGCVVWTAAKNDDGYGRIGINGRATGAHRVSYEDAIGPIPPSMCVCHSCDNPACINPGHLFLGSHQDNMSDMAAKGRRKHITAGARNGRSKLTAEQAREIRAAAGPLVTIARQYGVSDTVVSHIRSGKLWDSA